MTLTVRHILQTATPALHCLTSLLVQSSRATGTLKFCVGQLLPGAIEFIAQAAERDYPGADKRLVALSELLKAVVGVLTTVGEELRKLNRRRRGIMLFPPAMEADHVR